MKVVIIGGGAAGMMAAISASKNKNNQVFLYEKNEKLGKKLFITGKGRCNLTNDCDILDFYKNIVSNPKFMYSSFDKFNNKDTMAFFDENGLDMKVERGNRVFPSSDKSYDVTECLKRVMKEQGVVVNLNTEVKDVKLCTGSINEKNVNENKEYLVVEYIIVKDTNTNKEEKVNFDKLIIATGGVSYKSTGSTGDGYKFAKNIGLNVTNTTPSLVPIEVEEVSECKDMMGLTLKNVGLKIYDNKKKVIFTDFGELLFTHFGLSGPIILSASCYLNDNVIKDNEISLSIDLKPALNNEELDKRLLREIENGNNKNITSLIKTLLPSSMVDIFLDRLENNFDTNKKNAEITKEERKHILNLLKNFEYTFTKKRGYDEAIITQGGVDIKEIDPKTMQSKKVKNVYFAGEVLDVDCMTGGFNLQIAWTTGYVAGLDQ